MERAIEMQMVMALCSFHILYNLITSYCKCLATC